MFRYPNLRRLPHILRPDGRPHFWLACQESDCTTVATSLRVCEGRLMCAACAARRAPKIRLPYLDEHSLAIERWLRAPLEARRDG